MKRGLIILYFLLSLSFSFSFAQNSGFGGKRVLLKTDLINGVKSPFYSATAEVLLARRFTISIGGRFTTGKYNQIYFPEEYETDMGYGNVDNKLSEKATIKSRTLMLEGRYYVTGVVPAPKGSFLYLGYDHGSVDVKGSFYESLTQDLSTSSSSGETGELVMYEANGVRVVSVNAGWGYQGFINKRITWGFKLGFNKTFFNANKKYFPEELSGVAKTYGPNLLRLSPLYDRDEIFPVPSTVDSPSKGSFGLATFFQIGILLF